MDLEPPLGSAGPERPNRLCPVSYQPHWRVRRYARGPCIGDPSVIEPPGNLFLIFITLTSAAPIYGTLSRPGAGSFGGFTLTLNMGLSTNSRVMVGRESIGRWIYSMHVDENDEHWAAARNREWRGSQIMSTPGFPRMPATTIEDIHPQHPVPDSTCRHPCCVTFSAAKERAVYCSRLSCKALCDTPLISTAMQLPTPQVPAAC